MMQTPEYVVARRVLLDALDALGVQKRAVVLVGAQAVYLRVGDADIPVTLHTTDGDFSIRPELLSRDPVLAACMTRAGFLPQSPDSVGIWVTEREIRGRPAPVQVDLLVPEAVAGGGRRAAQIPPHGERTARKVRGLEGALYDFDPIPVPALEASDLRTHEVLVAGPAALLVAKAHKILERLRDAKRAGTVAKDALDVVRLLRGSLEHDIAQRTARLLSFDGSQVEAEQATAVVTREAWDFVRSEFGVLAGRGCDLAVQAAAGSMDEAELRASTVDLVQRVARRLTAGARGQDPPPR